MKALGIVRKIDELGRVVIPKEVRKTQGWDTGQPLEMFMDDNKFVIQAYGKEQEKEKLINSLQTWKSSEELQEVLAETIAYLQK